MYNGVEKSAKDNVKRMNEYVNRWEANSAIPRLEVSILRMFTRETEVRQLDDLALLSSIVDLAGYIDILTEALEKIVKRLAETPTKEAVEKLRADVVKDQNVFMKSLKGRFARKRRESRKRQRAQEQYLKDLEKRTGGVYG
jgi:hypothetical protein